MTSPDEAPVSAGSGSTGSLERLAREVANLDGSGDPSSSDVQALAKRLVLSETYSGSFPHPAMLKQFDSVVENGAERAFQLTEREQSHRHECDRRLIDAEVAAVRSQGFDRRLVIILVFLFLFASTAASVFLITKGHSVGAGLFGGASLVTVIGSLFALSKGSRAEEKSKDA